MELYFSVLVPSVFLIAFAYWLNRRSVPRVELRALMGRDNFNAQRVDPPPLYRKEERTRPLLFRRKRTAEERFFAAGIFSDTAKREFQRMKLLLPCFMAITMSTLFQLAGGGNLGILGALLGFLVGWQIPHSILERKKAARIEEISFFLPLVIEQISIGVSSSLEVGPCLKRVVDMADERDTHNVVTELIRHAYFHVKSGSSLDEALNETGRLSECTELKHAFLSLAQVAKHGGEVSRQLQELADAVSMQRETKIEAKIKKLELEATAPVALVFCGFLTIMLVGFGLTITKVF